MRSNLPAPARLVLHTLGAHMTLDGENCRVGFGTLAKETGLGRTTVIKHIKALKGEWIEVRRRRSTHGDQDANAYVPLIPPGVVSERDYPVPERDQGSVRAGRGVVSERDPNSRKNATENSIGEVFDYWVARRAEVIGKVDGPPMKATSDRLSKIRARLGEDYTVEQLREAIDGCLSNPKNVKGGHTDIELICRNQQKVEQYRTWAKNGAPGSNLDVAQSSGPTLTRAPRDEL